MSSSETQLALFADLLRQALEYVEDGGEVGGKGLSSDALQLSAGIRAALAGHIARGPSGRDTAPEGPVEFAVWAQILGNEDDVDFVAQVNGPREQALADARHYAAQAVHAGDIAIIEEVVRREVERCIPDILTGHKEKT